MSSNNWDGSSCIQCYHFQAVCRKQMFVKQQKIKHDARQGDPEWFIGRTNWQVCQSTISNKLSKRKTAFVYLNGSKTHSGTVVLKQSRQSKQNITPSSKGLIQLPTKIQLIQKFWYSARDAHQRLQLAVILREQRLKWIECESSDCQTQGGGRAAGHCSHKQGLEMNTQILTFFHLKNQPANATLCC